MTRGTVETADHTISELLDMGFKFSQALEAVEAVGPGLNNAIDFILNDSHNNIIYEEPQNPISHSEIQEDRNSSQSLSRMKQSHITDHLPSFSRKKDAYPSHTHQIKGKTCSPSIKSHSHMKSKGFGPLLQQKGSTDSETMIIHWEQVVGDALQRHFGFSSLKGFQKEAIKAWLENKDSLILAATGSGKSLCFQIPALVSGKIVIVISPLISLMHDQCLKLAKHGISACFLGSGQPDSTVEQKAMSGEYKIVYVCPETVSRLIEPLKRLAENNMLALFAVDEVHCISKWGHDFRPDYRRLSMLREKFSTSQIKSLKFDIPLMALTATATLTVREDIIKSLLMSEDAKVVVTSFFRPNLRFLVKHSKTSVSSYDQDFQDLINVYTATAVNNYKGKKEKFNCSNKSMDASFDENGALDPNYDYSDDSHSRGSSSDNDYDLPCGDQMTVEYLEDELDMTYNAEDFDVSCAEFHENGLAKNMEFFEETQVPDTVEPLGHGPMIIYVPTRKETTKLADFFCRSGVRAAAYHAKLPRSHLRRVHEDFQRNLIEVVVATIAFGMGIDKSNVRRIIHYGWPQSLEAYYQEAGRAGRDGKLSDCILYANFSRCPTLLPNSRSEEQTKQAYKMLSECFRYGMNTTTCRAKILVKYFGEDLSNDGCRLCDICVSGPPPEQSLIDEAHAFLHTLKSQCATMDETSFGFVSHSGAIYGESSRKFLERLNFRDVIKRIREQHPKFIASDQLWWRGFSRILEDMGYIKEADDQVYTSIKYPQITNLGMKFLSSNADLSFCAHPYADMLLSSSNNKPHSTFSEWGKGWADPEIRRRRLRRGKHKTRKIRTRKTKKSRRIGGDLSTVRGRLAAKLSNFKK